ncbi:MAG: polysaccharide biosynthesis protein [Campylobacterales bacterium]|nr:polysaccharide biosynthesis protein [Campylobacterales bacterium]
MFKPTTFRRFIFFAVLDILLSLLSLFLAYNLRFNFELDSTILKNFWFIFTVLVSVKLLAINYFKLYRVSWRFFSLWEAKKLIYAHIIAYGFLVVLYYIFQEHFTPFPRSVFIIDLTLSILLLGLLRFAKRLMIEGGSDINLKKTLLIGVSPYAQTIIKEKNSFYISAVVDDSEMIIHSYFANMRVGSLEDIEKFVKENRIETVIIAKDLTQVQLKNIYNRLNSLGIHDIYVVMLSHHQKILKSLSVEDLLARHPKDLDKTQIASFIKDKVVLITGAGGSIGSEIARQCVAFGARELILLDHSEFNLYTIGEELSESNIELVMQSVTDKQKLTKTFAAFSPDIVIHAAAYKHVPLCEANVEEAIINNVIGTKNAIDCAIAQGVNKFVLISTDKAVRPTNVMGTTKRICELYASNVSSKQTEIVAVRFGNVLGSSGSVIPKFRSQIEAGGPITVTHPDITRYFMLIPEACELVLQAASIGKGGELFILDMGEPVKIVDLAKKMIELSGAKDIEIRYSGLRAGEKLYEELLINESDAKTQYDSIMVAKPTFYAIEELEHDINELLVAEDKIKQLQKIVPEFTHTIKL